jgi:hypothetical protein
VSEPIDENIRKENLKKFFYESIEHMDKVSVLAEAQESMLFEHPIVL